MQPPNSRLQIVRPSGDQRLLRSIHRPHGFFVVRKKNERRHCVPRRHAYQSPDPLTARTRLPAQLDATVSGTDLCFLERSTPTPTRPNNACTSPSTCVRQETLTRGDTEKFGYNADAQTTKTTCDHATQAREKQQFRYLDPNITSIQYRNIGVMHDPLSMQHVIHAVSGL
jgi:hypothetical protein